MNAHDLSRDFQAVGKVDSRVANKGWHRVTVRDYEPTLLVHHEARANVLTNDAGDSVTGTAEYKVCAVEVKRLEQQGEQVVFPGSFYAKDGPGYNRSMPV